MPERRYHPPVRFVFAMVVGLVSPLAAADESDLAQGRALAAKECAACHAIEATGDSPLPEAPAFRTLGKRYPVEALEEALAEGIVTGHADMPEVVWQPDEIADFLAWLASIQEQG